MQGNPNREKESQPNQNQSAQTVNPAQPSQMPTNAPAQQATVPSAAKKATEKKHIGVMLITRTQLFMYIEGVEKVVIYPFSTDVVRDLDVINQQLLTEQLSSLITKNALPPASFSVVLGNATIFARQILSVDPGQKKIEEDKFLNTVPFEDPATQHIVMGQNTYLTAANKHFFDSIAKALAPHGYEITLILPEYLFSGEINLSHGLTADSALSLLKKMPVYREFNFLKKEVVRDSQGQPVVENKMKLQVSGGKSNTKFVIGGVGFMVIGFFVAIYLWMQQSAPVSTPPPIPDPTPVPEVEEIVNETPLVPASEAAVLASPSAVVQ